LSTVESRLKELQGDLADGAFAKRCGIHPNSMADYLAGRSRPGFENMVKIAEATGASLDWIAFGSGSRNNVDGSPAFCMIRRIASRPSAGVGAASLDESDVEEPFPPHILQSVDVKPEHARLLVAHGDSMWPTISGGDLLLVDVSQLEPEDGRIYVFTLDAHLFVKRLRRSIQGWMIVSDNREMYPPEPIPPGLPFDVHGVVRWVGRRL